MNSNRTLIKKTIFYLTTTKILSKWNELRFFGVPWALFVANTIAFHLACVVFGMLHFLSLMVSNRYQFSQKVLSFFLFLAFVSTISTGNSFGHSERQFCWVWSFGRLVFAGCSRVSNVNESGTKIFWLIHHFKAYFKKTPKIPLNKCERTAQFA